MEVNVTRTEFESQNESVRANKDELITLNKKMDIIIQKLMDIESHSFTSTSRRSGDESISNADIKGVEQTHSEERIEMEEITQGQELGVNIIAPLYLLCDIATTYSIT